MAYGKKKGSKPSHYVAFSYAVRKGKYVKGPTAGAWKGDGEPVLFRGSLKEEYLENLISFLKKVAAKDGSASFAVLKSKGFKKRDDEDPDDDSDEDLEDEGQDSEDEDPEEEEPRRRKKTSKGKKKGKKGSWDFDDSDDD